MDHRHKCKTVIFRKKLLESESLHDLGLGRFLRHDNERSTKQKIDKLHIIKIKTFAL